MLSRRTLILGIVLAVLVAGVTTLTRRWLYHPLHGTWINPTVGRQLEFGPWHTYVDRSPYTTPCRGNWHVGENGTLVFSGELALTGGNTWYVSKDPQQLWINGVLYRRVP